MTDKPLAAVPASQGAVGHSYLEWGPVLGGAAVAVAMSVILLQFGAAVGLTIGEIDRPDGGVSYNVVVAGLWTTVVALASSMAGGYLAGRMRARFGDAVGEEVEFRDGAHGLVVWAAATLGIALIFGLAALAPAAVNDTDVEVTAEMLRRAANVSTIFAFASAAGAALSAAGAYMAAKVGGEHRDKGVSVNVATPKIFRRGA